MKYIIFQDPNGLAYPIVFPEFIDHSFIKNAFKSIWPRTNAISAGFCNAQGSVYGESRTLGIESHQEDEWCLKKLLDID